MVKYSRTPGAPRVATSWHTVPVPGIERVSTMCPPYVDYSYLRNLFSNLRQPDQGNPNFVISPPFNNFNTMNLNSDSAKITALTASPLLSPEVIGEGDSCPALGVRKYVLLIIFFFYSFFCIDCDLAIFNTKLDKCAKFSLSLSLLSLLSLLLSLLFSFRWLGGVKSLKTTCHGLRSGAHDVVVHSWN
jgi:hypothetical protein